MLRALTSKIREVAKHSLRSTRQYVTQIERDALATVRDALVASISMGATGDWQVLNQGLNHLELVDADGRKVMILVVERPTLDEGE